MGRVLVVGDWDADGIVSAAEVVYAQEVLGIYPLKGKDHVVRAKPANPRTLREALENESGDVLILLDIPYTRSVEEVLRASRYSFGKVVYIDHHLSTLVHVQRIEKVADEVLVGRSPTAVLVAHVIKSLGGKLSPRLDAFVSAAAFAEKGGRARVNFKLVDLVVKISKFISITRDSETWEKLVRWLASPIPMTALPFSRSIRSLIREEEVKRESERVKQIAIELAPSAIRIANVRLVDARKISNVKVSALASQLYRVFKLPVIVIGKRGDRTLIAIRSRDDLPYRLAMELYKRGVLKDVGGHQSLAIGLLSSEYESMEKLASVVRECLRSI